MKEREERRECWRDGDDDGYCNKGGRRVVDPKIRGDQRQTGSSLDAAANQPQ
jgi:hypothetical protein